MTTDTSAAAGCREFRMPDVGEGLTEAEILKWYVAPGDRVTDGQVVCEVETAKAAVELPIPYDGVVRELRFDQVLRGYRMDQVDDVLDRLAAAQLEPAQAIAPRRRRRECADRAMGRCLEVARHLERQP